MAKGNPVFNFIESAAFLSYLLGIPLLCLWLLIKTLKQNMRFLGWFMVICGSIILLINYISAIRFSMNSIHSQLLFYIIIATPSALMVYTGWKLIKR